MEFRAVARFSSWGCNWPSEASPRVPSPKGGPGALPHWVSKGPSPQKNLAFSSPFGPQSIFNKDFNKPSLNFALAPVAPSWIRA